MIALFLAAPLVQQILVVLVVFNFLVQLALMLSAIVHGGNINIRWGLVGLVLLVLLLIIV